MKLKELLFKVKLFIINLLGRSKEFVTIGIDVVNNIKRFVDNPLLDVVVSLTTFTNVDNVALATVRRILPIILLRLEDCDDFIDMTQEEKLNAIIKRINSYNKEKRNALQLDIASRINAEVLGVSLPEAKLATLATYEKII